MAESESERPGLDEQNDAAAQMVSAFADALGHGAALGPDAGMSEETVGAVHDDIAKGFTQRFARLRPPQREYFRAIAEPYLRERGQAAAVEALIDLDYEVRPPSPREFITNPDYVPVEFQKELFPAWKPVFEKACDPAAGIFELNVTGASSIGKTSLAMLVMDYKMARTVCLKDAASFYGLAARSMIYFGLFATTKKLIKDAGFYILRDQLIDPAPFWRDMYPRLKAGQEYMRWPRKRIEVITGSGQLHALGRALFAVAADELNFFDQGEKTAQDAPELVAELSRRLESRFIERSGDIPGIAIYISQTRTTSDYLERRMREKKDTPGVLNVRGPRWYFNTKGYESPHPVGFRPGVDPTFRVYTGSETTDPKVLDKVAKRPEGTWAVEALEIDEAIPEGGRVIDVPVQHYRAFLDDIHGALRNIADVPSGSFTPFFPRREVLLDAFDIGAAPEIIFPFPMQTVPCYERSPLQLQDVFEIKKLTRIYMGRAQPIRHPLSPRYIHLDLSKGGDRTGFSMVHHAGHYRQDRTADEDKLGVGVGEMVKTAEADFYLALTAGPHGEPIDFRKVRVFIHWLSQCGYWIRLITADQYMSHDMLQRLREMGFRAEILSVDRTTQPYRDLRQAMNEGRVAIPPPPGVIAPAPLADGRKLSDEALRRVILYQELMGLEHDVARDKVDHRDTNPDGSKGSKDVADSLAGAVFKCLTDKTLPSEYPGAGSARAAVTARYNRYLPFAEQ